jgi:transcriptional regulator with XRE-family HTH domain
MPERSFGRTVRYRRTKLGISQARLGQLVGRSPATIRSWESDKSVPNDADVVSTLAAVIGVDERMLFDKAGIEQPIAVETSPTIEEALATLAPEIVPMGEPEGVAEGSEGDPAHIEASTASLFDTLPDERVDELEQLLEEYEGDAATPDGEVEAGHAVVVGPSPVSSVSALVETATAHTRETPTSPPPASMILVTEASYMEDPVEKRFYQVRTLATVAGIVALGIAFLWAVSRGLGAFSDWVSEFLEMLRI